MKNLKIYAKPVLTLTAMFGLSISEGWAQQTNTIASSTGIADSTLLFLMLGFIALLLAIISALSNSIKSLSKPVADKTSSNENSAKSILLLIGLGTAGAANAANSSPIMPDFVMTNEIFWLLSTVIIFQVVVIFILFNSLQTLIKLERGESFEEEEVAEDIFATLNLTDRVPVEQEETIMMDHEYDGIRELDNNLPPWWKYMFYATIIFAVVYLIRFHITGDGPSSHEEYMAEVQEAVALKAEIMADATDMVTEDNVVYLVDAPTLEKGAAIYKGNCATCHGQLGEGGAGPNLTDQYWIHGGSIKNVFSTIKYGVAAKGMIAWESQFTPEQMQTVASYVLSLQGTNPPNGKAPQGEIYVEEFKNEDGDSTTVVVEVDQ
jgi:cytochrome c oxidase cbb3-type subunit 3